MQHLNTSSTARASFSFYNNEQDIEALVSAIRDSMKVLGG
jgi:selenocysteine lyase/cysteine desulfurase